MDELQQLTTGKPAKGRPMLGQLARRIEQRGDELSRLLVDAVDTRLRNAEAHEDFMVEAETLEVVVGADRFDLDALGEATERLGAMVAAVDAAAQCFALDAGIADEVPDWVLRGERPQATRFLVTTTAAAFGHEVVDVDLDSKEGVVHLTFDEDDELTRRWALIFGASIVTIVPRAQRIVMARARQRSSWPRRPCVAGATRQKQSRTWPSSLAKLSSRCRRVMATPPACTAALWRR